MVASHSAVQSDEGLVGQAAASVRARSSLGGGEAGAQRRWRQLRRRSGSGFHCEICHCMTPPGLGLLIAAARHRCRSCERTVCGSCSALPVPGARETRICKECSLRNAGTESRKKADREKYVFLIRHAQSTWNRNVDLVKTVRNVSLVNFGSGVGGSSSPLAFSEGQRPPWGSASVK
ncbi:unnamed protein product, partial [Polarella glacialis]